MIPLLLVISVFIGGGAMSACREMVYMGIKFRVVPKKPADSERCSGDFTFERIGFENKITFCMKKMGDDMANKKIEKLMEKQCSKWCECGETPDLPADFDYDNPINNEDNLELSSESEGTLAVKKYWELYPWLVRVLKKDKKDNVIKTCTGTVITKDTILTSAQCCGTERGEYVGARIWGAGEDPKTTDSSFVKIKKVRIHPDFKENIEDYKKRDEAMGYNICLLKSKKEFGWVGLTPVCLPKEKEESDEEVGVVVAGWGDGNYFSNFLLPIVHSMNKEIDDAWKAFAKNDTDLFTERGSKYELKEKSVRDQFEEIKYFLKDTISDDVIELPEDLEWESLSEAYKLFKFKENLQPEKIIRIFKSKMKKLEKLESETDKQMMENFLDKAEKIITEEAIEEHNKIQNLAERLENLNRLFFSFPTAYHYPMHGNAYAWKKENCKDSRKWDKTMFKYKENYLCVQRIAQSSDKEMMKTMLCPGDHGAPALMKTDDKRTVLLGISSFQLNNGRTRILASQCDNSSNRRRNAMPMMFVDIRQPKILKWIKETADFDKKWCPRDAEMNISV